ncbi:MAG: magnesium chelatase [Chloroflexi bacterium RBG_13_52_12]|nr:MAG: magnesium chelatase [Chloroflexi bacterium RBG_13_52_12]
MKKTNLDEAKQTCEKIIDAVAAVFVGNKPLLKKLLAAGLSNGHVLFEDYPGLGKTLLAKVFARVIGCKYTRIQFTPDLLPADIVGTRIWRQQDSTFELVKGPVFTHVLLADEVNRTPPKTQAALLEAMEERQVTIDGETHPLESPFFVLGTQNPIEQEGTYPLPEAQMDRFMLKMSTGYAQSLEEESTILTRRIQWKKDDPAVDVKAIINAAQFSALQEIAENQIYIDKSILDYVSTIVRATREHPRVEIGASPRGGLSLLKVSRAMALINGRDFVTPDDIKMFTVDALAHRIILKIEESLEGVNPRKVVEEIVEGIPAPLEFSPR